MISDNLVYSVTFARSARKELAGKNSLWRIRIGDYRVVYSINDILRLIDITIIRHRNAAYRDLD